MTKGVQRILQLNDIPSDSLDQAIYQDIREMFLSEICSYIKASEAHCLEIKRIYYSTSDDSLAVRKIVRKICGGQLPEQDLKWLDRCIKAYFHKRTRRRKILEAERVFLWEKQERRCAICGQPLLLQNIHVDHIVPWDYVGDELEDNLQVLCYKCNTRKSNHVARTLHNLLFERGGRV